MRRRRLVALVCLAAAGIAPVAAGAQPSTAPVVGYLSSTLSDSHSAGHIAGFRQGLAEAGYVEGRNLAIEFRWAEGHYERLADLAAELVARPVGAILAASLPSAVAAKAATASVPIVFVMGADPVKQGIVASLARPGGNLTGVSQFYGLLGAKRLELLHELAPGAATVAVISNPRNPNAANHLHDIQAGATALGKRAMVLTASSEAEIDAAFAAVARAGVGALLVADDPFFNIRREQIVALAARHAVPAVHYAREFVAAGGLISYGSSSRENYRLAGVYVGRVLKGAKPADLPVLQPTAFELVINVKAASALGLTVPPSLLARADEVIE